MEPAKVYYTLQRNDSADENRRLDPAPQVSISPEYYYANGIVIGYTYNITIDGNATAIANDISGGIKDMSDTIEQLQKIKNIFSNNGGTLIVKDGDQDIIKAYGITIKSFSFKASDNLWYNYAPYTIELSANDVELNGCESAENISCNIPTGISNSASPLLVDMSKFRIRSFDDSWSFELSEDTIYNSFDSNGAGPEDPQDNITNQHFMLTYNINANGFHYYQNDNVLPAWLQAKSFCYDRLSKQVNGLIDESLGHDNISTGCSTVGSLQDLFEQNTGLLNGLGSEYEIYNENIKFEPSEIAGSCTMSYNCLVKKKDEKGFHILHSQTKTRSQGNPNSAEKDISITYNGTIQGLIVGGLFKGDSIAKIGSDPNGQFFTSLNGDLGNNKYINAKAALDYITEELIKVEPDELLLDIQCDDEKIKPSIKDIKHNYNEGSIDYTLTFDRIGVLRGQYSFRSVTISEEFGNEIPQHKEFIIPGRADGPIIQSLSQTYKPRKLYLNIEGRVPREECCTTIEDAIECDITSVGENIPAEFNNNYKLLENSLSTSTDGSYSIKRTYIEIG